jgi:hypothetical protein
MKLTVVSDSRVEKPKDVVYMSDTVTENTLIMQPEVSHPRFQANVEP